MRFKQGEYYVMCTEKMCLSNANTKIVYLNCWIPWELLPTLAVKPSKLLRAINISEYFSLNINIKYVK